MSRSSVRRPRTAILREPRANGFRLTAAELHAMWDRIREMTDGTIDKILEGLAADEQAVNSAHADRLESQQTKPDFPQRIVTIRSGLGT